MRRNNRRLYRIARAAPDLGEAEDALQDAYRMSFAGLAAFRGASCGPPFPAPASALCPRDGRLDLGPKLQPPTGLQLARPAAFSPSSDCS
jgi:hypothetical protein